MSRSPIRALSMLLLMSCVLASGCRSAALEHKEISSPAPALGSAAIPVIRSGRYTLMEIRPEQSSQALLEQVIEITLPPGRDYTLGDGLRYVLRFSGYRLGEQCPGAAALYDLPLPAAHLRLGPLPLQAALQTLVGPSWTLLPDHVARRLCFIHTPQTLEQTL